MSIFISYRRSDTDAAVLFYSWLRERFGPEQVFWDRENIPPGAHWADVLRSHLRDAAAIIVLIGPDWVGMADEHGHRRLDDPSDWVRQEVLVALENDVRVIQVLMGRSDPLRASELPAALAELAEMQALELSDLRIRQQLIEALDEVVEPVEATGAARNEQTQRMQRLLARQVHRLQVRAVELIQEGKTDRALDELREGSEVLLALLELSPGDLRLDAQLGYLYSTLAQNFDAVGDIRSADTYADLAVAVHRRILAHPIEENLAEVASAVNGLAGIMRRRGRLEEATRLYVQVVRAVPSYAYAWHDLYAVLDQRARQGPIDVELMELAAQQVRATGLGQPGLSAQHLDRIDGSLRAWQARATNEPARVAPVDLTVDDAPR